MSRSRENITHKGEVIGFTETADLDLILQEKDITNLFRMFGYTNIPKRLKSVKITIKAEWEPNP